MGRPRAPIRVGDVIAWGLRLIGVTDERVSRWIGTECGCRERRRRLNALSDWAWSVIKGRIPISKAREELDKMLADGDQSGPP